MSTEPIIDLKTAEAVAIIAPTVEAPPQLVAIITESGVGKLTADRLMQSFAPSFSAIQKLIDEAQKVDVTDATMVSEMKRARTLRLGIREVRVAADKLRERLKLDSKREGDAIQGCFNLLKFKAEPIEERLQAAEDYAIIAEAERKSKLKAERETALRVYGVDTSCYLLGDMPAEQFTVLLTNTKASHEMHLAAVAKAAEDQRLREQADAAERERIRLENEQLKREAEEKEASLVAEREKAAAAAEQARKEKEAADVAAAKAKAEADAALAKAKQETEAEFARLKIEAEATLAEQKRLADEVAAKEKARIEAEQKVRDEKARLEREAADAKAKAERDAIEAAAKKEREAAAAKLAEQNRLAEEAAATERKRAEAERADIEAKAAAARKVAEKKAAEERKVREALEAQLRAKEAEEKAKREAELEAAKKAAAAPDKDKLITFANQVRALELPELSTEAGRAVAAIVKTYQEKLATFAEEKAGGL